ncbi:MAG: sugar ABC transporter ATP-binding protein [Saccharofermentanales bacterium]
MDIILEMKGICKSFAGVQALDNVDFNLRKGEVHALIGENGAGKSTLMNILLGMIKQDSGEIFFKGKHVNFKNPLTALNNGISMIHQEICLVPQMDVAENIWLGRENKFQSFGMLNIPKRLEATKALLNKLEIHVNPQALVKNISIANMQLVELARAISYEADIIIMDEPTSALTNVEIELLYKIVRNLSARGVSIIFISHKIEEIFQICQRVTVLRDGRFIATHNCAEIDKDKLISQIVGRELTNMFPKTHSVIGEIVLEVNDLNKSGVFSNINFNLRKGEILGFCGLMGAGRTEIMSAIFGLDLPDSGEIIIDGRSIKIGNPSQAISHGIGMVTEDRLRLGALHGLPVFMNLSLATLLKFSKLRLINFKKEKTACVTMVEKLSITLSTINQLMKTLSGGNQQKVILGKWLMTNPKILILDEPTRGIDVGSKAEIHKIISELASQGMSIILVSSELPEILGMSDRIIVIGKGEIKLECSRAEATQEKLMTAAFSQ